MQHSRIIILLHRLVDVALLGLPSLLVNVFLIRNIEFKFALTFIEIKYHKNTRKPLDTQKYSNTAAHFSYSTCTHGDRNRHKLLMSRSKKCSHFKSFHRDNINVLIFCLQCAFPLNLGKRNAKCKKN